MPDTKYKVGQKVRIVKNGRGAHKEYIGKTVELLAVDRKTTENCNYDVKVLFDDGDTDIMDYECIQPSGGSFEWLYDGYKIKDESDNEFEVLFANGKVAIIADDDGDTESYSKTEFENCDFVFPEEEDVEELTVEEISRRLGKTIKVVK